jgi:S-adenosylmethionine/arginine decarboxylase-like enzyme
MNILKSNLGHYEPREVTVLVAIEESHPQCGSC